MMWPSYETYKRMVGSTTGVWAELVNDGSIELAIKLSADLTKAVLKGAPITLLVSVVGVANTKVRIVGLRIEDDKNDPVYPHGPQEVLREQENFEKLLKVESTFVTFFDELVRPVMVGRVHWDKHHSTAVLEYINNTLPHYQGNHRAWLIEAMDLVKDPLRKWHLSGGSAEAPLWKSMPLYFENLRSIEVGSPEGNVFILDDPDEGGGLEKSAHLLLEANYPGTAHLNPDVDDGSKRREFCDVLVVGENELIVIQSKVMAMLERNPEQSTERRVKNVQSHFQKAISQLNGSVRMLRQGHAIYTNEGMEIPIDAKSKSVIHGIVLLSSTNLSLPWDQMSAELLSASRKSKAEYHVLQFAELQQHVVFGKTLDEFSQHSRGRFKHFEQSEDANIETHFLKNRPIKSASIGDDSYGYVFAIEIGQGQKNNAENIFTIFKKAIQKRKFTGRCEYFMDFGLIGNNKCCWIALGMQWEDQEIPAPNYDWWVNFREEIRPQLNAEPRLSLTDLCEMATLHDIRASGTLAVVIEFVDGKVVGHWDPDSPNAAE